MADTLISFNHAVAILLPPLHATAEPELVLARAVFTNTSWPGEYSEGPDFTLTVTGYVENNGEVVDYIDADPPTVVAVSTRNLAGWQRLPKG